MTKQYSPYLEFDRSTWCQFRQDTPLTLTEDDLDRLRGHNDPVSISEVKEIYLPLSRLLSMYVEATQGLYEATSKFLGHPEPRVPYIIGVAGSVAVGKSTTSRILQALLSRWPSHPKVSLVTTDGFLYPNKELERRGLMERKGFPESFDVYALLQCLNEIKSGKAGVTVPVYSHAHYDILPDEKIILDKPDIVIVEGLNVLQVPSTRAGQIPNIFVSDFFDFSIYVDADINIIEKWYLERFMNFRKTAENKPELFMNRFAKISETAAMKIAENYWHNINAANYRENVEPYKQRAHLVLQKGENHCVETILLRKI